MKGCDDYGATIQLYLDKELSGQELDDFPAHLEQCEACRAELEAEERLSALLHRTRPLYSAPDALRARVMQAAESFNSTTSYAPADVRRRIATASARPLQAAGVALTSAYVSRRNSSRCCGPSARARNSAAVDVPIATSTPRLQLTAVF